MLKQSIANTFRNLSNYLDPNPLIMKLNKDKVYNMLVNRCIELNDPLSETQKSALDDVVQKLYTKEKPISKKELNTLLDQRVDESALKYVIKLERRDFYAERTKGLAKSLRMNKAEIRHGWYARGGCHHLSVTNKEIYELYDLSMKLIEISNCKDPFLDDSKKVKHLWEILPSCHQRMRFKYFKIIRDYLIFMGIIGDTPLPAKVQNLE